MSAPAFRPLPLLTLWDWIVRDLDGGGPVLGIPRESFVVPPAAHSVELFGRTLAAPLGVAAGPHTQLAQNIVAAWLCGARFIELKTVQVLDDIHVPRPCIDVEDAGYNCEWSQELRVAESYEEYLKAWVILHALAARLGLPSPGVIFSTSIGYNLEGIRSAKIQGFLRDMRDARPGIEHACAELARRKARLADLAVPATISNQITLSTMHGCPPDEIERIAKHLLEELGFHTWVKLNPTLLGPELLRRLLNQLAGFDIAVPDDAFAHDPRFEEAVPMLRRLQDSATHQAHAPSFGVKLSNTLEVENRRPIFPANEKTSYLSGRALHPLTVTLAARLREALDGAVAISFCGGADAHNYADLIACDLGPVTVCTDLLRPGGYARLAQYSSTLDEALAAAGAKSIGELAAAAGRNLARYAERVVGDRRYAQNERHLHVKGPRPLGAFDCIAAPCVDACPAHQDVPAYLGGVARGDADRALDVILATNALPAVTGAVCDHPCVDRCVLNHYDGPLGIREIKRFAVENRTREPMGQKVVSAAPAKVAIVGAGPGGLGAAHALAQRGIRAIVFESRREASGMVGRTIPAYRVTRATIDDDLARLRSMGIEIRTGVRVGDNVTLEALRAEYPFVVLAIGAQAGKRLGVPGEESEGVFDALTFLERAGRGEAQTLGERVLVVGAGNSAMDAARTARRLVGDRPVSIVYRRTRAQMPADPEEIVACRDERIEILELVAPLRVDSTAGKVSALIGQRQALGPADASGRPRAVPIDGAEVRLPCDTVVVAIGQEPVLDFAAADLALGRGGTLPVEAATLETRLPGLFAVGDLVRGPSSIIQAIGDGRVVAAVIAERLGAGTPPLDEARRVDPHELLVRRSTRSARRTVPLLPPSRRVGFAEVQGSFDRDAAMAEASRCLECDLLCSLCVTVCPNRALLAYTVAPRAIELPRLVWRGGSFVADGSMRFAVAQDVQIVNVADSCNQCGDCTTFCPTAGQPWREKPRFWVDRAGFETDAGDCFHLERLDGLLRIDAKRSGERYRLVEQLDRVTCSNDRATTRWSADGHDFRGAVATAAFQEGEALDLTPFALLCTVMAARSVLP